MYGLSVQQMLPFTTFQRNLVSKLS